MQGSSTRWIVAAGMSALLLAACGGSVPEADNPPVPESEEARARAELEALYRARVDSARMRFTEADTRFMTGMIHHHAQALVMAEMAETNSASPAIRRLAARIHNAQRDEIATMQRWLQDRDQPGVEVGPGGHVHGSGQGDHHMPGMLTAAELEELGAAEGSAFDRLFLEFMIRHHQGAVTMVHELFATDGAGQDEDVFRFASDVQVDQKTEIDRMQRMLDAMAGASESS
ncbi:MAG TPA: DUF305 domain-containing protein [Longimicrobiales bacterium]|nr:DUF305 domain-containing protein [Longimicrobiales bacterium]